MRPIVDGLQSAHVGRLQVVRFNFEDSRNERVMRKLGIRVHPVIVLFDRHGNEKERVIGQRPEDEVRAKVETFLAE